MFTNIFESEFYSIKEISRYFRAGDFAALCSFIGLPPFNICVLNILFYPLILAALWKCLQQQLLSCSGTCHALSSYRCCTRVNTIKIIVAVTVASVVTELLQDCHALSSYRCCSRVNSITVIVAVTVAAVVTELLQALSCPQQLHMLHYSHYNYSYSCSYSCSSRD